MPTTDYTVVSQVQDTQYVPGLQQTVAGWRIAFRDSITGTIGSVFVANDVHTVDNVRAAIENALVPIRQIAQLGTPPKPAEG